MLAFVGFATIGLILVLLLSQRVTAIVALAGVPLLGALVAGFTAAEISGFVSEGLNGVVGVAAMFMFAIIFFGVLRDAGMFDPIVDRIISWAGESPVTIAVATTVMAIVTHLDGAGASTFLLTIPAMLPLYERLGMSRLVLATCVALGAGVMNVIPWGGPTLRAATTVDVGANELWVPLLPAQGVGILTCVAVAYWLGVREKRRLARLADGDSAAEVRESTARVASNGSGMTIVDEGGPQSEGPVTVDVAESLKRPKVFWVNIVVFLATVGTLISGLLSPEICFIIGTILVLLINYPGMKQQGERINAHAPAAILMGTTLLAAGVLLGIFEGSGMIEAMARAGSSAIPEAAGPVLPLIVGVLGVPLSLVFGPDAYYFGVLPVLNGVGAEFGVDPVHITQASILGQETVGFPISPMTGAFYLLVGLAKVDIGRHIRHSFGWLWLVSVVMLLVAVLTGVIPGWAA